MEDETEVWLEALSGRASGDRRGAASEARALRAALLRQSQQEPADTRARDASREAALLERARRAGLIPARQRRMPLRWERLASWPALAAYTALACSAVVALILWHSPGPAEIVRGAPERVAMLEADDPVALKQTLIQELRAAGVDARGYQRLGVQGIDADLPKPVPDRVRAILARHHLGTPPDAVLRIEIRPASP